MTIDNTEPTTPDGWTPQGAAYAMLAQAQKDLQNACTQIRVELNNVEALECIREAKEQIASAEKALNPKWMLAM